MLWLHHLLTLNTEDTKTLMAKASTKPLYDRTQPHRQILREQQQKGKLEERATTEVLM